MMGEKCPHCESTNTRPYSETTTPDLFFLAGAPYDLQVCSDCGRRFKAKEAEG